MMSPSRDVLDTLITEMRLSCWPFWPRRDWDVPYPRVRDETLASLETETSRPRLRPCHVGKLKLVRGPNRLNLCDLFVLNFVHFVLLCFVVSSLPVPTFRRSVCGPCVLAQRSTDILHCVLTHWVCDGIADTGYEAGVVYQRLCLIYLDDAELKHHHDIHILSQRQHQTVPTVPTEPPDLRPPLSTADEFEELWSLLESTNLLLVLSCSGIGCPLAMLVPVTFPQTLHLLTTPRHLPTQILHRQIRQKIVQNTASGEVCSWPRVLHITDYTLAETDADTIVAALPSLSAVSLVNHMTVWPGRNEADLTWYDLGYDWCGSCGMLIDI